MNPGNAIRYARLSAIESLASGSLRTEVQTVTGAGTEHSFEIAVQALSGTLGDLRVIALWADVEARSDGRRRLRQVFALVCHSDQSPEDWPKGAYPDWLVDPSVSAGRICATGIAGPTWKSEDQAVSALRDARLALAIALESHIEKRIFDDGRGVAKMARQIDPSPAAIRRAATALVLQRDWLDEHGEGPLGLPGVLYGLVCIEN